MTEQAKEMYSLEDAISDIIKPEDTPIEESNDLETLDETSEEETIEEDEAEEGSEDESEDDESDEFEDESEDEEAEAEEGDDQEAPETITVKVDGEEVQVTLDDLKRGYSGQQYVQKGMQEAAAMRKEAEQVYQSLLSERQQLSEMYQQMQSGAFVQPPKEPTAEMFDADPIGYMEAKMKYDGDKAKYDAQMGQMQQITEQQSAAEQRALEAYLQREVQQLKAILPEFGDANTATKLHGKMVTTGTDVYGYTPEEINSTLDHRALHVLHDAMKYREILAGKATAEKKAKPAKRVIKPGAKRTTDPKRKALKDAQAKLKRTGSIDDALNLIMNT